MVVTLRYGTGRNPTTHKTRQLAGGCRGSRRNEFGCFATETLISFIAVYVNNGAMKLLSERWSAAPDLQLSLPDVVRTILRRFGHMTRNGGRSTDRSVNLDAVTCSPVIESFSTDVQKHGKVNTRIRGKSFPVPQTEEKM